MSQAFSAKDLSLSKISNLRVLYTLSQLLLIVNVY